MGSADEAPAPAAPAPEPGSWAAPAWLTSDRPPGTLEPTPATQRSSETSGSIETSPDGTVAMADGQRASLGEVAERLERIKASAAVVREALQEREASAPATLPVTEAPPATTEDHGVVAQPTAVAVEAPSTPAPAPVTKTDDFAARFLDDDFDEGEDAGTSSMGMSTMGSVVGSRRPIPWIPIVVTAVVLVGGGVWLMGDGLTGAQPADTSAEADVPAEPEPAAAKEEPAPEPEPEPEPEPAKEEVAPEAVPEPGTGQPVEPEAKAEEPAKAEAPAPAANADPDAVAAIDEARALYKRQKLKAAGEKLDEVLTKFPKQPDALLLSAQVQLESGNMDDALTTASSCVQVAPDLADCWLTIGVLQQNKKDKDAARAAYEKYLALAPDGSYARDVKTQLKRLN